HGPGGADTPVSLAALEVHEHGYLTRMLYAIRRPDGQLVAGDRALAPYPLAVRPAYTAPALLGVYESSYGNAAVRVAVVFEPAEEGAGGDGMLIQIAEPMEYRTSVALDLLWGTLLRQGTLLVVLVLATLFAVKRALRPLDRLKAQLDARVEDDLAPLVDPSETSELAPMVGALNGLMERLQRVLGMQQRFVSDASHQLRTPLAVLKAQIQSGMRGDAPPATVLAEIAATADRAVNLANKMLSLTKVEQLRGKAPLHVCDLASIAQDVAIDLSPLISEKNIDFDMEAIAASVAGHPWMISELLSNLMHNAIRHTPPGGRMGVRIEACEGQLMLTVWDSGGGLAPDIEARLFEPFAATHDTRGCGLGLHICRQIAASMNARLSLKNRVRDGVVRGLDASLLLAAAAPAGQ
ncbi:MAG TPA: sensor histidine kinase, partial [Telluria sp.]|nr:sensor histidine kinase [Telluria sp.]